jgi:pimeloyl-ACP methyl ester carboxylesterase
MQRLDHRDALVVLIHGLGRTAASMWPLAMRLRRAGFEVARVGYPSTRLGVADAVTHVRGTLTRLAGGRVMDLVGHSLGGLIAARLLRDPGGLSIRRAVQLGSPNLGSAMADLLGVTWPVRRLCGPAVEELRAHRQRTPADGRIAAIAGTGGFWKGVMAGPHDGTVAVRSAWSGAGHRAAVPVLHSLLPASSRVAWLVMTFLRQGSFQERAA